MSACPVSPAVSQSRSRCPLPASWRRLWCRRTVADEARSRIIRLQVRLTRSRSPLVSNKMLDLVTFGAQICRSHSTGFSTKYLWFSDLRIPVLAFQERSTSLAFGTISPSNASAAQLFKILFCSYASMLYKKLGYRRWTVRRAMLVNSCYVSRAMGATRFQTTKVTFKVIQGHWQWCHIRFPISPPLQLRLYLAQFPRYYHLFPKN